MNRLRMLREERRWTMEQLAERVVPPTTASQISKLEKGRRRLTVQWMERLADALSCRAQELVASESENFSFRERHLIETFRGLSDAEQSAFLQAAEALANPGRSAKKRR